MNFNRNISQESPFKATPEAEGRLLLLIDAFSSSRTGPRELEGRIKLAKLDFLIRYPKYLFQLLQAHVSSPTADSAIGDNNAIEQRMIRYRYGPWDPAYYAILGSLIGRGLIEVVPLKRGFGYRTTERGKELAKEIAADDSWRGVVQRIQLVRRHLDKSGTTLKNWIYDEFPEIADATWQEPLH